MMRVQPLPPMQPFWSMVYIYIRRVQLSGGNLSWYGGKGTCVIHRPWGKGMCVIHSPSSWPVVDACPLFKSAWRHHPLEFTNKAKLYLYLYMGGWVVDVLFFGTSSGDHSPLFVSAIYTSIYLQKLQSDQSLKSQHHSLRHTKATRISLTNWEWAILSISQPLVPHLAPYPQYLWFLSSLDVKEWIIVLNQNSIIEIVIIDLKICWEFYLIYLIMNIGRRLWKLVRPSGYVCLTLVLPFMTFPSWIMAKISRWVEN